MKRNVKYIGEAVAVALLAAGAPVVIPMITPSTITQAADFGDKTGELNLTSDTSDLTVSTGTSLSDSKLQSGNSSLSIADDYAKDSSNSSVVTAMETPIYGQSLYTTKEAAMSAAGSDNFDPATTNLGDAQNQLSNGTITTADSYYQTISYKLSNDSAANSILNGEYNIYVDGKQGTNGTDFVLNKTAGTITIVRQFTVEGGISTNLDSIKTVDINSSTDIDTTNYALLNGSNVIPTSSIKSDDTYYTDDLLEAPATSDEIANGKFLKSGRYYHKISFTLASGDASKDTLPAGLTAQGNTITAIQEIDVNGTVNQGIQEPNVTVGESVSSDNDTDSNTLTNSNGSLVDTTKGDYNGVSFGTSYYKEGTSDTDVLNNNVSADTDVVDSKGDFAKTGTYLRTITFNLIDNSVDTDTFGIKEGSDYKLDTQNNTVTYVQKVHIDPKSTVALFSAQSALIQADVAEKIPAKVTIQTGSSYVGASLPGKIETGNFITINGTITDPTLGLFYSTSEAALSSDPNYEVLQGQTVFKNGGRYYRTITFDLKDPDKYSFYHEVGDKEHITKIPYIEGQDYKIGKDTVTFAQEYDVNVYQVSIPDLSITVEKGDPVSKVEKIPGFTYADSSPIYLNGKDDISGDTYDGKKILSVNKTTGKINYSVENVYYDDINDASAHVEADGISPDKLVGKDSDGNDAFQTIGTYYRVIEFHLDTPGRKWVLTGKNVSQGQGDDAADYTTYYVIQPITVTSDDEVKGEIISPDTNIGKSVTVEQATEKNDVISKNGNGDSIKDTDSGRKVEFGTDYYPTTARVKDILAGTATKSDDAVVSADGSYASLGTYYRTVTIPIIDNPSFEYDLTSSKLSDVSDGRKSLTYVQTVTIGKKTSETASGIVTDVPVKVNANDENKDLSSTDKYTLADNGNSLIDTTNGNGVSFSDDYYTDDTAATKVDPSIAQKYTITKPGDYYRKVIFNVSPETLANYDFTRIGGVADTKTNTVTFMQKVEVKAANSSSGSGSGGSSSSNNNANQWTYYQDAGVVTTKSDKSVYNLNNQDNGLIGNRALAKNTSWVTDQYRTNSAGVKQYRVATGEWIDADDVNFQEQADNTTDDWTYYQDPGVVRTIIGQEYYSLNNQANEAIGNRALAKESSWVTDQYRTNSAGVKEYRVATGEWIDAHDVTFIKDIKNIVNVDETSSYYNLYDIDREVNGSRALEKKTSWQADKKAVDPDGNVYYRVATNEWVKQVKGVYLDTSAWY